MSKRDACSVGPEVNGKVSKLYLGLRKLIGDPMVVDYIYSAYTQLGVADKMSAAGYKVGPQGQHSYSDVMNYMNVASMINQMGDNSIIAAKKRLGAVDDDGNLIKFSNPKEIISKVNDFNASSRSLVASIAQNGNDYVIIVRDRTSATQLKIAEMRNISDSWRILEQVFNSIGIDLNDLAYYKSTRSILNITNLERGIELLKGLKQTNNRYLTQDIIEFLLLVNKDTEQGKKILSKWGTPSDAAIKIKESFSDPDSTTKFEKVLIDAFLSQAKEFKNLDLEAIQEQLKVSRTKNVIESEEGKIEEGIQELNKIYNLNAKTILIKSDEITKVSQTLEHALFTLERQLRELTRYNHNDTDKIKELENKVKTIHEAIISKSYYNSIAIFLSEVTDQLKNLAETMPVGDNLPAFDTVLEGVKYKAKYLNKAREVIEGYKFIVEALTRVDTLLDTEELLDEDKADIKKLANTILQEFTKLELDIKDIKTETAITAFKEILGDSGPNGMAIADILSGMQDSSIYDYLYSMSRASNPLINAIGGIIRNAQDSRTAKLHNIEIQIRRAHSKLQKAGIKNTRFMYTKDGRIISDIDWDKYIKARNITYSNFKKQGLKGQDLENAMQQFTNDNTIEKPVHVDSKGKVIRTERIPNNTYRLKHNPVKDLKPAELEYYETMIQLKAELETLLPNYAISLYTPPQIRREFLDILFSKDVFKKMWNKIKDIFIWREDDTDLGGITLSEDEDLYITRGNIDNTIKKEIPIHYIKILKDQGELLRDFSSAMIHLANTSINYACLSEVKDTVEFLSDTIKDITPKETKNKKFTAELIERVGLRLFKHLKRESKATNNAALLDGWIDMHVYGIKLKDYGKFSKLIKSLLHYESVRALAINVKGMIANATVGEAQILIEAGAGEFFNFTDYGWAKAKMFGSTLGIPGRFIDFLNNNKDNYDVLISDMFEPVPGSFEESTNIRFYSSKISTILSNFNPLTGYSVGERLLHYTTMYAMLHNTKVLIDGEKTSIYDAFTKVTKDNNSELILKDNVTDLDGNPITMDYIENLKKRIRLANQTMHGSMSQEDKGVISQYLVGRAFMQFRQWMVESYSKRFRSKYIDASTGLVREGNYITTFKYLKLFITKENHGKMSEADKFNIRRTASETVMLIALFSLTMALGGADDENEGEFWFRMFIYTVNRTMADIASETPLGLPKSSSQVLKTLIPLTNTLDGFLYPFYGIKDAFEEYERGDYKGENKYKIKVLRKTVPFWNQIEQLKRFSTDDRQFNIFDN